MNAAVTTVAFFLFLDQPFLPNLGPLAGLVSRAALKALNAENCIQTTAIVRGLQNEVLGINFSALWCRAPIQAKEPRAYSARARRNLCGSTRRGFGERSWVHPTEGAKMPRAARTGPSLLAIVMTSGRKSRIACGL